MSRPDTTRREFVSIALAGATASSLGPRIENQGTSAEHPSRTVESPIRLGVASYSLRNFSRDYAIHAIRDIGTRFVNIKSFHQPYESGKEQLEAGRRAFESAGLQIVGGGTITLDRTDDADIGFYFDYARVSGMPLMVIAPTRETLPRIERFVREYDIEVAVHNHGPEDEHFPGPQDVLPVIRDMDPRVGVCLDVGHTARTGIDVVEAAEMCGQRLLDIHMKDLKDLTDRESQTVVGEGAIPVARLFRALTRMNYGGYVNLEYEIDPFDPVPGMKRSFAFMRGVLSGLSVS